MDINCFELNKWFWIDWLNCGGEGKIKEEVISLKKRNVCKDFKKINVIERKRHFDCLFLC